MEIKIHNKTGQGKISFSWKERWIILKKGHLTLEKESVKTFINCLFDVLIKLNWALPKDIRNRTTDISKDKITGK